MPSAAPSAAAPSGAPPSRHPHPSQSGRSGPPLSALSVRDLRETAQALRRLAGEQLNGGRLGEDAQLQDRLEFAAGVLDSHWRARGPGTAAVVDAAAWSADRSCR